MQEYLPPLVDPIHDACPEKMVSCKGLVILTLEVVNEMSTCLHQLGEGYFCPEVGPGQPHKVSCAVAEFLGNGNHVKLPVQDLARLFIGELVLAHGNQDLHSHGVLLSALQAFCRRRYK